MIALITTALRAVANVAASTLLNTLLLTGIQQLVMPSEDRVATTVQHTFLTLLPQSFTIVFLKSVGTALAGPTGRFTGVILALILIERYSRRRHTTPTPLVIEATPLRRA